MDCKILASVNYCWDMYDCSPKDSQSSPGVPIGPQSHIRLWGQSRKYGPRCFHAIQPNIYGDPSVDGASVAGSCGGLIGGVGISSSESSIAFAVDHMLGVVDVNLPAGRNRSSSSRVSSDFTFNSPTVLSNGSSSSSATGSVVSEKCCRNSNDRNSAGATCADSAASTTDSNCTTSANSTTTTGSGNLVDFQSDIPLTNHAAEGTIISRHRPPPPLPASVALEYTPPSPKVAPALVLNGAASISQEIPLSFEAGGELPAGGNGASFLSSPVTHVQSATDEQVLKNTDDGLSSRFSVGHLNRHFSTSQTQATSKVGSVLPSLKQVVQPQYGMETAIETQSLPGGTSSAPMPSSTRSEETAPAHNNLHLREPHAQNSISCTVIDAAPVPYTPVQTSPSPVLPKPHSSLPLLPSTRPRESSASSPPPPQAPQLAPPPPPVDELLGQCLVFEETILRHYQATRRRMFFAEKTDDLVGHGRENSDETEPMDSFSWAEGAGGGSLGLEELVQFSQFQAAVGLELDRLCASLEAAIRVCLNECTFWQEIMEERKSRLAGISLLIAAHSGWILFQSSPLADPLCVKYSFQGREWNLLEFNSPLSNGYCCHI